MDSRIRLVACAWILGTALMLAGCATAPAPEPEPAPPEPEAAPVEARPARPEPEPVPRPFRIVGESDPGAAIEVELEAEGFEVAGRFDGRAAGIEAFCAGNADALALSADLEGEERQRCRALGGGWSALSDEEGRILYVRYQYGQDLLDRSEAF